MPPYNVLGPHVLPQGFYTNEELLALPGVQCWGKQWSVQGGSAASFRVVRELTMVFCCPELRLRFPVHLQNKECMISFPKQLLFDTPRQIEKLTFYFELWNGSRIDVQFSVVLGFEQDITE